MIRLEDYSVMVEMVPLRDTKTFHLEFIMNNYHGGRRIRAFIEFALKNKNDYEWIGAVQDYVDEYELTYYLDGEKIYIMPSQNDVNKTVLTRQATEAEKRRLSK